MSAFNVFGANGSPGIGEGLPSPQPSSESEICKKAEIGDRYSPSETEKRKHVEIGEGSPLRKEKRDRVEKLPESKPPPAVEVDVGEGSDLFDEAALRRKERIEKREVTAAIWKQYGMPFPSSRYYKPIYPCDSDDEIGVMYSDDDEDENDDK